MSSTRGSCCDEKDCRIVHYEVRTSPKVGDQQSLTSEHSQQSQTSLNKSCTQNRIIDSRILSSGEGCCDHKSYYGNTNGTINSTSTTCLKTPKPDLDGVQCLDSNSVDLEQGGTRTEHITIMVQGMDCTGCEKKLYKSLRGCTQLRNIKTSLMLAQASFDIIPSCSVDSENIVHVIEKITGFSCTTLVHTGAKLDLDVSRDFNRFSGTHFPAGVTEISVQKKNKIQVSYNARIVGARELLANPFFHNTALAPTAGPLLVTSGRAHLVKTCYPTLLSVFLTIPVLVLAWAPIKNHATYVIQYGGVSLALATFVQFFVAGPFYMKTTKSLFFSHMIDMDLLIVLSSSSAYIYSVYLFISLAVGKSSDTEQFFETSTLLITLIMVGRTASTAVLLDPKTQQTSEIDVRLLQYGDLFKVSPDMPIVTDGIVVLGESEVDESAITGEATLIHKVVGMRVNAASINHSGSLVIKVTRLPHENTVTMISDLVNQARSTRPKVQDLADQVAGYFVPAILIITLVVFIIWILIGKSIKHLQIKTTSEAAVNAMKIAMSVLIVSCPCAVGLAVPMVVIITGGVAAQHGLIFKTSETMSLGRSVSHVIFDKTGTLTQGKLTILSEEYFDDDDDVALRSIILGLTGGSKHPVSKAITAHLLTTNTDAATVSHVISICGSGIEGTYKNSIIRAGNPYWLNIEDDPKVEMMLAKGLSMFCVTLNSKLVALYGLHDDLRSDAASTVAELKKRNISVSIVSGDNEAAVQAIAAQLRIPLSNVRSRHSPEQKQAYVKCLMGHSTGFVGSHTPGYQHSHRPHKHKHNLSPTVLFIGDGTNDAPSLAQASIGLHISEGGIDVASSAADAVLIRPTLAGIITLIDLSKAFHRRVVFNFLWSAVYNLSAILLAAGVFSAAGRGFTIPPQYAGLGEVVSVVPVIGSSVAMRWWKG